MRPKLIYISHTSPHISLYLPQVMRPKLIFLDEPTSGLDAFAAHG